MGDNEWVGMRLFSPVKDRNIRQRRGFPVGKIPMADGFTETARERSRIAVDMRNSGLTFTQIAAQFGVTRERARQIYKKSKKYFDEDVV